MTVRKVDRVTVTQWTVLKTRTKCEAGPSNRLLRNEHQFCENPFCLGRFWHEWGCCSVDSTVIDSLLSEALSEDKNSTLLPEEAPMRMSEHSRYALPKTDEEIKRAREGL